MTDKLQKILDEVAPHMQRGQIQVEVEPKKVRLYMNDGPSGYLEKNVDQEQWSVWGPRRKYICMMSTIWDGFTVLRVLEREARR